MAFVANKTVSISVFTSRYFGNISSPLYLLLRAIVTWTSVDRQGKCYKIVTFDFDTLMCTHFQGL